MNPRERVRRTIDGKSVDRLPFTFRAEAALRERLCAELNTDCLEDYFAADTVQVQAQLYPFDLPNLARMDSADDVDGADWPGAEKLDLAKTEVLLRAAHESGRAVLGGVWASIFTNARRVMGEERYMLAMYQNPEMIQRVIERVTEMYLAMNERLFSSLAGYIDIFYFGSDFGTQASLFISPDQYRFFFKSNMKRLVDQARGYGLKVMFHSCGAVTPIIPDLIEIGVDLLDPVQVSAAGMNPQALASQFKGQIIFHGGISAQRTLPLKSPAEVRAEVLQTIKTLGPQRLIVSSDQEMIGDVTTENIIAMVEAVRSYQL